MQVRTATIEDLPAVLNVLDGGLLVTDVSRLQQATAEGSVLVAVPASTEEGADRSVVGTVVVVDGEIEAIAVRRRRRDQGIGTRLVEAACERYGDLSAEFDERVRPFWESLGFSIRPIGDGDRLRGQFEPT